MKNDGIIVAIICLFFPTTCDWWGKKSLFFQFWLRCQISISQHFWKNWNFNNIETTWPLTGISDKFGQGMVCVLLKLTKRVWFDVKHVQFDQTFGSTRILTYYLNLIVRFWYVLAAYWASLVKLWSIFGLDIVWAKIPMAIPNQPNMPSKGTQKGKIRYLPHPNLADCNTLVISGQ